MAQKTNTNTKTKVAKPSEPVVNPVEAKLDRIIELLEGIAMHSSQIPFQGLDCSRLVRK